MPGARLTPHEPAARPRGALPRLAYGAALLGAAVALRGSLGFALAPGSRPAATRGLGPWAAAGEAEAPRTQMRGRYAEGGRSRQNNQGGGRLPIRVTRNPVLAYSITENTDQGSQEPGSSVLRRMWDMYDMDFNRMAAERQRYFRPGYRRAQWQADWNMRLARRQRINRVSTEQQAKWLDWMRREGRKQGLTEPIPYNGPPLTLTPEEDEFSKPENMKKRVGSEEDFRKNYLPKFPTGRARVPEDMEPGKWNNDGPDNIFKIWKRPLHKWSYDIGKQGKWGPVVRGIVM